MAIESSQDSSAQPKQKTSYGGPYMAYAMNGGYVEMHGASREQLDRFVQEHPDAKTWSR